MPAHGHGIRPVRQILVGIGVIATAPAVAWWTFHWHFLIGLLVGVIYGAGALTIGTAYIVGGAAPLVGRLAQRRRARLRAEAPDLPRARALPPADRDRSR